LSVIVLLIRAGTGLVGPEKKPRLIPRKPRQGKHSGAAAVGTKG
jgi:hypothetical protein